MAQKVIRCLFINLVGLLVVFNCYSQAVDKPKPCFFGIIEFTYLTSINISGPVNAYDSGYTFGLRFLIGYQLNPEWSIGLGGGLDGYHSPTYNTLPIFLDARFRPAAIEDKWFFASKVGFNPESGQSMNGGYFFEPSFGRTFFFEKKLKMNVGLVYKWQVIHHQFALQGNESNVKISSIGFNVSFQR